MSQVTIENPILYSAFAARFTHIFRTCAINHYGDEVLKVYEV